jgi:hypothetical protein
MKEKTMAKRKSKKPLKLTMASIPPAVVHEGNTITFVNTLTSEGLEKHRSWLTGHGMTGVSQVAMGSLEVTVNDAEAKAEKHEQIKLIFDTAEHADTVFGEIAGDGALDADEWHDDTRYFGNASRAVTKQLSDALKK